MGIYDREYYRREGPSFLGSIANTGQACKWLILANVLIFVVQLLAPQPRGDTSDRIGVYVMRQRLEELRRNPGATPPEDVQLLEQFLREAEQALKRNEPVTFTSALWLDPDKVLHGQVWRLLTYAFLHDTGVLWHILFNMLFLWWFGRDVEEIYGTREFLTFYLAAAVVGGLAFVPWALRSEGMTPVCVGASGAVTAVLVLTAFHFPTRMIYIWYILPVPIWLFVLFQIAQDTFVFLGGIKSVTAVTVHLGGAALGFLYYKFNWRLSPWWSWIGTLRTGKARPRLRLYREEAAQPAAPAIQIQPSPVSAPVATAEPDEHLEAKLDAVLEKVARSGRQSLTPGEEQILQRASEVYRRRRS